MLLCHESLMITKKNQIVPDDFWVKIPRFLECIICYFQGVNECTRFGDFFFLLTMRSRTILIHIVLPSWLVILKRRRDIRSVAFTRHLQAGKLECRCWVVVSVYQGHLVASLISPPVTLITDGGRYMKKPACHIINCFGAFGFLLIKLPKAQSNLTHILRILWGNKVSAVCIRLQQSRNSLEPGSCLQIYCFQLQPCIVINWVDLGQPDIKGYTCVFGKHWW